jgi:hypothetical protein
MSEVGIAALGVGGTLLTAFLVFLAGSIVRAWHSPKRLDRLELAIPVMIRGMLAVLRCQKDGRCNGETDEAIGEIEEMLSEGIVSQKARAR